MVHAGPVAESKATVAVTAAPKEVDPSGDDNTTPSVSSSPRKHNFTSLASALQLIAANDDQVALEVVNDPAFARSLRALSKSNPLLAQTVLEQIRSTNRSEAVVERVEWLVKSVNVPDVLAEEQFRDERPPRKDTISGDGRQHLHQQQRFESRDAPADTMSYISRTPSTLSQTSQVSEAVLMLQSARRSFSGNSLQTGDVITKILPLDEPPHAPLIPPSDIAFNPWSDAKRLPPAPKTPAIYISSDSNETGPDVELQRIKTPEDEVDNAVARSHSQEAVSPAASPESLHSSANANSSTGDTVSPKESHKKNDRRFLHTVFAKKSNLSKNNKPSKKPPRPKTRTPRQRNINTFDPSKRAAKKLTVSPTSSFANGYTSPPLKRLSSGLQSTDFHLERRDSKLSPKRIPSALLQWATADDRDGVDSSTNDLQDPREPIDRPAASMNSRQGSAVFGAQSIARLRLALGQIVRQTSKQLQEQQEYLFSSLPPVSHKFPPSQESPQESHHATNILDPESTVESQNYDAGHATNSSPFDVENRADVATPNVDAADADASSPSRRTDTALANYPSKVDSAARRMVRARSDSAAVAHRRTKQSEPSTLKKKKSSPYGRSETIRSTIKDYGLLDELGRLKQEKKSPLARPLGKNDSKDEVFDSLSGIDESGSGSTNADMSSAEGKLDLDKSYSELSDASIGLEYFNSFHNEPPELSLKRDIDRLAQDVKDTTTGILTDVVQIFTYPADYWFGNDTRIPSAQAPCNEETPQEDKKKASS